ncbi:MAG: murein biosynthesis integral membrane protein MurJ [Candidatus Omnitrophota bacterium]|nr:MAG: murein biosynthesis integral membrane protein MurJ [Candidatus Omnitrophota bacterium]
MFKKVIKDTSLTGAGTLICRFLGFIRDILIAASFGTSPILEAFLVAFRLPNLFRSIFGEGFADSIAVPVLAEHQKDKNKVFGIGSNLISLFFVALAVITLLGVIFSKYLVLIIAPGFLAQAHKFNLAVSFTRITFFYLLLIGISVNINAILQSLKKFFIPSLTPAFLNVSFIIGVLFFSRFFKNYILAICVIVAGVIQIAFPYIFLQRQGFSFKFNFRNIFQDKDIIKMLKLFPPRIWSSVIYHLSVILDTILCSLTTIVGEGAIAAIYFANRLIQFPFALIALSISRVIIVDLSSCYKDGNIGQFKKFFIFSFQNIVFFIIPISAAFLFIPQGIIDVIFRRGEFTDASLIITSGVLFFYAFGLFFFCLIKLLVSAFYALKDTATAAKTTGVCLLINVILSVILMFPLKVGGVALGSSAAAACNVFLLYRALIKKIGRFEWEDTGAQFLKVAALSIVAAGTARILWLVLDFSKYFKICIIMGAFFVIFVGIGSFIGIKHLDYVKRRIFRKIEP